MEMNNEETVEVEQQPFKAEEIKTNAIDHNIDFTQFDLGLGF